MHADSKNLIQPFHRVWRNRRPALPLSAAPFLPNISPVRVRRRPRDPGPLFIHRVCVWAALYAFCPFFSSSFLMPSWGPLPGLYIGTHLRHLQGLRRPRPSGKWSSVLIGYQWRTPGSAPLFWPSSWGGCCSICVQVFGWSVRFGGSHLP